MNINDDCVKLFNAAAEHNMSILQAINNAGYSIEKAETLLSDILNTLDYPAKEKESAIINISLHVFSNDLMGNNCVAVKTSSREVVSWDQFYSNIINYVNNLS